MEHQGTVRKTLNLIKPRQTKTPTKRYWNAPIVLALCSAIIAGTLLFYARPISEYFVSALNLNPTPVPTKALGKVVGAKGKVFVRSFKETRFTPVRKLGEVIHNKDFIKTERGASLQIELLSGEIVELEQLSQAFIEEWASGSGRDAKTYLTMLRGNYKAVKVPENPNLYVVKERKIVSLAEPQKKGTREIVVNTEEAIPVVSKGVESLPDTAPVTTVATGTSKEALLKEKIKIGDTETLSNQYVEKVLSEKAPLFRRCQIIGLREGQPTSGELLFSLTIQPSGKVNEVKVVQRSVKNPQLESCVIAVLERTQFRSYEGKSFSLSYPLSFR